MKHVLHRSDSKKKSCCMFLSVKRSLRIQFPYAYHRYFLLGKIEVLCVLGISKFGSVGLTPTSGNAEDLS